MKKNLTYLLSALLLAGCARDTALIEPNRGECETTPVLTADETEFLAGRGMSVKFNEREIDRIVGYAAGFFDEISGSTRSSQRTVSKITPISGHVGAVTRSEGGTNEEGVEEEFFYIVDFDNDEGYALISADRRLPDEVLVNVGNGSFPHGEIDNPGLAVMLSRLDDYVAHSIARHEAWQDSVEVAMLARLAEENPELAESITDYLAYVGDGGTQSGTRADDVTLISTTHEYGPWMTEQRIAPMIPVEWGQEFPFNARASNEKGKQVYTGCVATASIQLMSYWQKPTSFHDQTIDWATTNTYSSTEAMAGAPTAIRNTLTDLFWNFGEEVDMYWGEVGVDGSSSESQDAIHVLDANGFTVTSKQNYNSTPVLSSLNNGRPVYMRGNSHKTEHKFLGINWWSTYQNGHAWLIDGYLKQQRTRTITMTWEPNQGIDPTQLIDLSRYTTTSIETHTSEFFHNNFGWDGTSNGYYICGMFDANNDADLPSNTRGTDGNFIYQLEMWTNIR